MSLIKFFAIVAFLFAMLTSYREQWVIVGNTIWVALAFYLMGREARR